APIQQRPRYHVQAQFLLTRVRPVLLRSLRPQAHSAVLLERYRWQSAASPAASQHAIQLRAELLALPPAHLPSLQRAQARLASPQPTAVIRATLLATTTPLLH